MGKYYKVIVWAVVIISFMTINSLHVDASTVEDLKNKWYDTHFYPINQGNEEWQKHSMEETLEINNPPYELLLSMTSEELAELVFAYPSLSQITSYYNTDGGYDYGQFFLFLESESDIFYELLRREDGILAILKQYQKSGVDAKWFEDEAYNNSEDDLNRWYSEIFGSQFIHVYSKVFTKEESDLTKQIISEKNSVYVESPNACREYFDISDIEYYEGNFAGQVRTIYIDAEKIAERETKIDNVVASDQIDEVEREEELTLIDDNPELERRAVKMHEIIILVIIVVLAFGGIFVIRKKINDLKVEK